MSYIKHKQTSVPNVIKQYGLAFRDGWSWFLFPAAIITLYLTVGKDVTIVVAAMKAYAEAKSFIQSKSK